MLQNGYRKLVSKVLKVPKEDVLPLQNEDITRINEMLYEFGPRMSGILVRRFGMYCEKWTLRKLGETFRVCPERIRQLERQALSALKRPSRIKCFRHLTKAGLEKQLTTKEVPLLKMRVCDFELSTRTRNCLMTNFCGPITIGELANENPTKMLRSWSGLGPKSLAELKSLLQSLGLDFATRH